MKKAILDLDGTLLDSTFRHFAVLNRALINNRIYIKDIDMKNYIGYKAEGNSTSDYLEKYINDAILIKKISSEWVSMIEDDDFLKLDKWYYDVGDFLHFLKEKSYRTIILTARKREDAVLKQIEESEYKDLIYKTFVVSPEDAKNSKASVLKESNEEKSIVVGDTEVDLYAAEMNGISFFALNRGFRNRIFWKNRGIKSFDSLYEIMEVLL